MVRIKQPASILTVTALPVSNPASRSHLLDRFSGAAIQANAQAEGARQEYDGFGRLASRKAAAGGHRR
nr:hypothetical protein [Winslowiella iniecta]